MSDTETVDTTEVEQQARELGWAPQADFKGDPEKWVDAKTYLERGEQVLPIVKATNRRLREDLTRQAAETAAMKAALAQSQETIAALQEFHEADTKDRVDRARKDLLEQLKQAKRDENVDREVELTDELSRLNTAVAEAKPKERTNGSGTADPQPPRDYTKDPEFVAWHEENQWYGTDFGRTNIARGIAQQLRLNGDQTTGRAFLDRVVEGTQKEIQRLTGRPAPSKVEGSRGGDGGGGGGGGGGPNGKSYNDLPAAAKEVCDKFAADSRLVGPGKLHKDIKSFRESYVKEFYRGANDQSR